MSDATQTTPFIETTPRPATIVTPALSVLSAWLVFALLQALAYRLAGAFEYPLDDPYIHLAIAETIANGGYGVNTQELSSPGSSALYPLLLLPFEGTAFHRFMPLIWNIVGLTAVAYLWGRLLAEAGYCRKSWRALGIAAAVLGPIAFMVPMVAYVGMEHSLHAAAALAVVLGLYRHFDGRGGLVLIMVGAFLGTALRMEGAALGLLAAAALVLSRKPAAGVATGVLTVLPLGLFAGYLMSLGLDPTPSSVQAKLALGAADGPTFLERRFGILGLNLRGHAGMLVGVLAFASFAMSRSAGVKDARFGLFAGVVALAALAHLSFGQIGWLSRYEHYILLVVAAGFLALLPKAIPSAPGTVGMLAVAAALIGGFWAYKNPMAFFRLPETSRAIHIQQAQMAVFAKEYLNDDVAVNDLGWVAFQNPNYVLDLWGLASAEARTRRLANPTPGWAGELTEAADVPAAMVYEHWFDDGIGTDWVKIGTQDNLVPGGFLGGFRVTFYATKPEYVDQVRDAVVDWIPTLDERTEWIWAEGMEP